MRSVSRTTLIVLGVLLGSFMTLFIIYNNDKYIQLDFLNYETTPIPLWFILLLVFFSGSIIPILILFSAYFKNLKAEYKQKGVIERLEQEIHSLRNRASEEEKPVQKDDLSQ